LLTRDEARRIAETLGALPRESVSWIGPPGYLRKKREGRLARG
jgi:hypothetical protein